MKQNTYIYRRNGIVDTWKPNGKPIIQNGKALNVYISVICVVCLTFHRNIKNNNNNNK